MSTYTDHDGRQWTINQTVSELSQDLHQDLVGAVAIAKALQAERDHRKTEFAALAARNKQLRDAVDRLEIEADRQQAWQDDAIATLKRWDQCGDLVPGSFKVFGARLSDCTFAYIDHLRAENRALHRGISEAE